MDAETDKVMDPIETGTGAPIGNDKALQNDGGAEQDESRGRSAVEKRASARARAMFE